LKEELKKRGASLSGKKADFVDRLFDLIQTENAPKIAESQPQVQADMPAEVIPEDQPKAETEQTELQMPSGQQAQVLSENQPLGELTGMQILSDQPPLEPAQTGEIKPTEQLAPTAQPEKNELEQQETVGDTTANQATIVTAETIDSSTMPTAVDMESESMKRKAENIATEEGSTETGEPASKRQTVENIESESRPVSVEERR